MHRDQLILVSCLLILLLGLWLNTGTMAPYASSHLSSPAMEPCKYQVNIDHQTYLATYRMMNGESKASWEWSVVLRRVLYPLLAYPAMHWFGFETGGFITNVILTLLGFALFVRFVGKEFGSSAANAAALLLATYPGIYYWSGLPYAYALLVPLSLTSFMLLWRMSRDPSPRTVIFCSMLLGIFFTGYDLLPYYGTAALLILATKKRWLLLPVSGVLMIAPTALVGAWLYYRYGISPSNENSDIYKNIILAYLHPADLNAWWDLVLKAPAILWHNYLYSNFLFLPLAFLVVLLFKTVGAGEKFELPELALMLAVVLVALFNELAPPYSARWQIRGEWVARLYQPIFVVFMYSLARAWGEVSSGNANGLNRGLAILVLVVVALGNAATSFGQILGLTIADHNYYNFYEHSAPNAISSNMELYGRRPYGFCRPPRRKDRKN